MWPVWQCHLKKDILDTFHKFYIQATHKTWAKILKTAWINTFCTTYFWRLFAVALWCDTEMSVFASFQCRKLSLWCSAVRGRETVKTVKGISHAERVILTFHISKWGGVQMRSLKFLEPCKHGFAYSLFVGGVVPHHRLFLFPLQERKSNKGFNKLTKTKTQDMLLWIKTSHLPGQVQLLNQVFHWLYSSPWAQRTNSLGRHPCNKNTCFVFHVNNTYLEPPAQVLWCCGCWWWCFLLFCSGDLGPSLALSCWGQIPSLAINWWRDT